MKTQTKPTRWGLRRRQRRGHYSKTAAATNFIPRCEQLEERTLLAGEVAAFKFTLTDTNGVAIPAAAKLSVGQTVNLNVSVQDVRPASEFAALLAQIKADFPSDTRTANDLKGFFQAYFNLDFDAGLVTSTKTSAGQLTFGPAFSATATDKSGTINNSTGEFIDLGDLAKDFGNTPLQNGNLLSFLTTPFRINHAPLAGVNDTANVDQGKSVEIKVLNNDKVEGTTTFAGSPADLTTLLGGQVVMIFAGGDDPNTNSSFLPLTNASQLSFTNVALGITGRKEIVPNSFAGVRAGASVVLREVNGAASDGDPTNNVLLYTPPPGFSGPDSFTYRLRNADDPTGPTQTITVNITVKAVNQPPTFASSTAATQTIPEDAGVKTINLSSISPGLNESNQALRFVATSNNQTLLPNANLIKNYTSPNSTGNISYTTAADKSGTAIVSVQLFDAGLDGIVGNADDLGSAVKQFTINVTAVNDAPKITANATALSVNEGANATRIDAGLTVTDVEANSLTGGSVKISPTAGGAALAEDLLAFNVALMPGGVLPAGISVSAASGGVINITGVATAAVYQNLFRSFTYKNTSVFPSTVQRTVKFSATDNGTPAATGTANRAINVTSVNSAPVLGPATTPNAAFNRLGPAVVVDGSLTLSDLDSATMKSAKVQITTGFQAGTDKLTFAAPSGIVGNYNATTGLLTFSNVNESSPGSRAAYQAALRSVEFSSSSNAPGTARTLVITVDDGSTANNTASVSRGITVTDVQNSAPVIALTSFKPAKYKEQKKAAVVAKKLSLSDADGTTLKSATVKITTGFQAGFDSLTFKPIAGITADTSVPGVVKFTNTNANAPVSFKIWLKQLRAVRFVSSSKDPGPMREVEFMVDDGMPVTATGKVVQTVNIIQRNDAPVLTSTSAEAKYTSHGQPVVVDGAMSLSDPENGQMTGVIVKMKRFQKNADQLAFTPTPHITGSYNAAKGTLTLTGLAQVTEYEAVLRSITFNNTSATPTPGIRTLTIQVREGKLKATLTRTVSVSLGTTPQTSRVSGFVYLDGGQSGLKDSTDVGVGKVSVTLKKTGDASFTPQVKITNRDGFYEFTGLAPGAYTIEQTQPALLTDGKETPGSSLVTVPAASNDKFAVQIGNGGQSLANNNFGETVPAIGANPNGLTLAVAANGQTQWYALGGGWPGFKSASATITFNGSGVPQSAEIQVVAANNAILAANTSLLSSNANIRVSGNQSAGVVLEILGSSGSLDFQPVLAEGEAVDFLVAELADEESDAAVQPESTAEQRGSKIKSNSLPMVGRLPAPAPEEDVEAISPDESIHAERLRAAADYAAAVDALSAVAWSGD